MKGNAAGEAHSPRLVNRSVHEALIRLIPAQAQRIRQKTIARLSHTGIPPPRPKEKESQEAAARPKKAATKGIRWEEDEASKQKELELKQQEEFDRIWEKNCEARARACEEKLVQLLGEQSHLQSPDASRVASCLETLEEVRAVCPPFAHVLNDIFHELSLALFCPATKDEKTIKVPFFELVQQLDVEIKKKELDEESWKASLYQYQEHIEKIEEDMRALTSQVKNADFLNKNLHASLSSASNSVLTANEQVTKSKQKLLDLKMEVKNAKAEIKKSKSLKSKLEHEDEIAKQVRLKAKHAQLMNERSHYLTFLETAQNQIEACVPRSDYIAMKAQILELQQRLADIQAKSIKITYETKHLTPRPDWDLVPGVDKTLSTLEKVAQICRQNASLSNRLALLQSEWTDTNVALAEANQKFQASKKNPNPNAKK